MEIKEPLKAFSRFISLLMFFLTFFANFYGGEGILVTAFIRAIITFVISTVVMSVVVFIWEISFSDDDWRLMTNPPKEFDDEYLNISGDK